MPPMKRKTPTSRRSRSKRTRYTNKVTLVRPIRVERKWRQVGYAPIKPTCGQVYAVNPFYYMTNGANQDGRVGLNISNVNLHIKAKFTHWGTDSTGAGRYSSSNYRVIVVASPNEWNQGVASETVPVLLSGGTGNNLLLTDVFMDSGIDRVTSSFLNKDTVRVLYDSGPLVVDSTAVANNYNNGYERHLQKMVKIGDLRFKYNGNSYCRDDNVYVIVASDLFGYSTTSTDLPGIWSLNLLCTYADS